LETRKGKYQKVLGVVTVQAAMQLKEAGLDGLILIALV
jgi:hypothetical protein